MTNPSPTALAISRPFIRGLIVLNGVYAFLIGALLLATLLYPPLIMKALGVPEGQGAWELRTALRTIIVIGLIGAYVAYRVLREVLAIIDTVRAGDPFIADNVRRLHAIAWWVLVGEVLRLLVGIVAWAADRAVPSFGIDFDIAFSITPWLAVLLIFVLARVFEQGTLMRTDLEGTV
jgi:hypothetical protein